MKDTVIAELLGRVSHGCRKNGWEAEPTVQVSSFLTTLLITTTDCLNL